jgi:cytidyltransferase-like protein
MANKKVMISGCYDLIHGGHVQFFKEASEYGDLYVAVGADENILKLKHHSSLFSENERVFMVQAIRYVHKAFVSTGEGYLDYEPDMSELKPDYFVVNEDGHRAEKEELCKKYGVEYVILKRIPAEGLPPRSSTDLKKRILEIDEQTRQYEESLKK